MNGNNHKSEGVLLAAIISLGAIAIGGAVYAVKGAAPETVVAVLGLIGMVVSTTMPLLLARLGQIKSIAVETKDVADEAKKSANRAEKVAEETKKVADETHVAVNSQSERQAQDLEEYRAKAIVSDKRIADLEQDKRSAASQKVVDADAVLAAGKLRDAADAAKLVISEAVIEVTAENVSVTEQKKASE